jgi:hypothetical protein
MWSPEELSNLRFAMSDLPEPGGQRGDYEEKWSQWFLERSFFRDFTFRNPRGKKKGEELADAVVLFDDVGLLVQVKAQHGQRAATAWAEEAVLKALSQVKSTYKDLTTGAIKKLKNDLYGEQAFEPAAYPNLYGIIIVAHDSNSYDPRTLVPELDQAGFPIHVFSLKDFALLTHRFDSAGDFINLIELRTDAGRYVRFLVNDERENLLRLRPYVRTVFSEHMQPTTDEMLDRAVDAFEWRASGAQSASADWRFSLAIDDMIARAHDQDPKLPWNNPGSTTSLEVARYLGWLTRDRRIRLGKRIIDTCKIAAKDGEPHYFSHFQKSRGTVGVYFVSALSRSERVDYMRFLVAYARYKYGAKQCFGVATEPLGGGRSYDFMVTRQELPQESIDYFATIEDPFAADGAL